MTDAHEPSETLPGHDDLLRVAARLAAALDADDFDAVAAMLRDDVVYRIGDAVHHGPDAVVRSYRDGSALAKRIFDHVEYSHEIVGAVGERTVRIDFGDDLVANGEHLDHHSVQDVEIDRDGRIVMITDRPVPGQKERGDAFLARHGLSRDS